MTGTSNVASAAAAGGGDFGDSQNDDDDQQQRRRNYQLINSFAGDSGQVKRMTGEDQKIIWVRDPYQNLEKVVKRAITNGEQNYEAEENE